MQENPTACSKPCLLIVFERTCVNMKNCGLFLLISLLTNCQTKPDLLFELPLDKKEHSIESTLTQDNSRNIETELKLTLNRHSHQKIKDLFKSQKILLKVEQKNYYFDQILDKTTNQRLLEKLNASLRLRIKNRQGIITLKTWNNKKKNNLLEPNTGIIVRNEYECLLKIPSLSKSIISGGKPILDLDNQECIKTTKSQKHPLEVLVKTLSEQLPVTRKISLAALAMNATTRYKIPINIGSQRLTLELDKTIYPDTLVGYELEVELPQQQSKLFALSVKNFLDKHEISYKTSETSKDKLTFSILDGGKNKVSQLINTGALEQI